MCTDKMNEVVSVFVCCSELHLATTWSHLTEGIVVDNDVYRYGP